MSTLPDLVALAMIAVVVGAAGLAVGILLIAPRLGRWVERDEDRGDRDD